MLLTILLITGSSRETWRTRCERAPKNIQPCSHSHGCYLLKVTKCQTNKVIEVIRKREGGKEQEKETPKLMNKTQLKITSVGSHVNNARIQRTKDSAASKRSSTCC